MRQQADLDVAETSDAAGLYESSVPHPPAWSEWVAEEEGAVDAVRATAQASTDAGAEAGAGASVDAEGINADASGEKIEGSDAVNGTTVPWGTVG